MLAFKGATGSVPLDVLARCILDRRCPVTQKQLREDEDVISRAADPSVYELGVPPGEVSRLFLEATQSMALDLFVAKTHSSDQRLRSIRRFWARALARGAAGGSSDSNPYREWLLHSYLFVFWEELTWADGCEPLLLDERLVPEEERTWPLSEEMGDRIGSRARKDSPVDIIGRRGTTLFAIEVKYGGVDDRAVGQLLRYFETLRLVVHRADHRCDLRRVIPVLVVADCPESTWIALPTSLRELLLVFFYEAETGDLVLRDGRRSLQNRMRGRNSRYAF